MKYLVAFIVLVTANFCVAQPAKEVFQLFFEHYLNKNINPQVPGYAIGIFAKGTTFTQTFGVRKLGVVEKIDEETVFRLASVSKTFTPAAVVLMEDSMLNLDSTINSYLPNLQLSNPDYQSQITVRHILSHTTGIMPHAYTNLVQANVPYEKIVKKLKNVEFVCMPGDCYGYQNVVYNLAGDVIAKAGKTTYEKMVENKLFSPLGMTKSSFGLNNFLSEKNRAIPHRRIRRDTKWLAVKPKSNYYQLSPAAGVNASLNDMMNWLGAQLGKFPDVLSHTDLDHIHRPYIKTSRRRAHYGRKSWNGVSNTFYALGWRTFSFNGEENFIHHGGWVEGVRVEMVLNRRLDMGMVFLTNSEPAVAGDIVPMFIRTYLNYSSKEI